MVWFLLALRSYPCYPEVALGSFDYLLLVEILARSGLGLDGGLKPVAELNLGQNCPCHGCVDREASLLFWDPGEGQQGVSRGHC